MPRFLLGILLAACCAVEVARAAPGEPERTASSNGQIAIDGVLAAPESATVGLDKASKLLSGDGKVRVDNASKALKAVGKAAVAVEIGLRVVEAAKTESRYQNGNSSLHERNRDHAKNAAGLVAGAAGGWAGAEAGAVVGAVVGSVAGPPGAAVGAVVGAVIGGVGGAIGGNVVAEQLVELAFRGW